MNEQRKIKVSVDGHPLEIEAGSTVLQACEGAGVEIPSFCYHPRLSIAGNCRMCLVEVKGSPSKPVASCAMPAGEGMEILTQTPMVEKARKSALEFLLINHPLDCPICDQGGECDLQDLTIAYGKGTSRFQENKRAVPNKYFGPFIKTIMTRCIHCTRCIRFASEVAGVTEIGTFGRGEHMEITTYLEGAVTSELSGNLIDICPVGALTSKPYAFQGRPWELKKTESIDVLDAVGSNIRIDSRGIEVMRILPRLHEDVNEEWISDKTRFSYDGLKRQRLDRPYLRENGKLRPATWAEAFDAIGGAFHQAKPDEIGAIVGDLADCESMMALKDLLASFGSSKIDCRQQEEFVLASSRADYLFNTTIAGIEKADVCLLVGTNPRVEAAIVNARLRKRYLQGNFKVALIGPQENLTYPYEHLGSGLSLLKDLMEAKHPFSKVLKSAKFPMVILGQGVLRLPQGEDAYKIVRALVDHYAMVHDDWNGFNVLPLHASRVGALDLSLLSQRPVFKEAQEKALKVLYLLGADDVDVKDSSCFVIYQGHHGDKGAMSADVVLPGAAYTEKTATYVNLEGRVQQTFQAIFPLGEAKEDWHILVMLAKSLQKPLPYETFSDVRSRLQEVNPIFQHYDYIHKASYTSGLKPKRFVKEPVTLPIQNFYMTDVISRVSENMAKAVQEFTLRGNHA
jgi:NADH-quinone oxidoreductase subunit G